MTDIPRLPRGIRNNNPGNIRLSGDAWLGLAPKQADPDFFVFLEPYFGIRALAVILRNYAEKHGAETIAAIVKRWAPPNENDTSAYVEALSAQVNADPDERLNLRDPELLAALAKAIIHHENGIQPYSDALIDQAIGSALA